MKKLVCLILTVLMIMSLVACNGNDKLDSSSEVIETNSESFESEENVDINQTNSEEESGDSAEWKEFLKDYEKWVDDYIAIVKRQKENPTDITILTEYTKMLADLTKWTEKADKIAKSIEGTNDALEYSKEVLRIAGKLAEVGE